MTNPRPNRLVLHYYTGAAILERFGHVAIEYNGRYYSYGKDSSDANLNYEMAIAADAELYGEHISMQLPNPTTTFDLHAYWEAEWHSAEYDFLYHNCAHSALTCLQKLGVLQNLNATREIALNKILRYQKLLKPSDVADSMQILTAANIKGRRRVLSKANRLDVHLKPEETAGIKAYITEINPQINNALKTKLAPILTKELPAVEIKMLLKDVMDTVKDSKESPEIYQQLQQHYRFLQAIEPDIKSRIAKLLEDEINLFHEEMNLMKKPTYFKLIADLMILMGRLPKLKINELKQEIWILLFKYQEKGKSDPTHNRELLGNLTHCKNAMNVLTVKQQIFSEIEYDEFNNRQLLLQLYKDGLDSINEGINNFLLENYFNKKFLSEFSRGILEDPEKNVNNKMQNIQYFLKALNNFEKIMLGHDIRIFKGLKKNNEAKFNDLKSLMNKLNTSEISIKEFYLETEKFQDNKLSSNPDLIYPQVWLEEHLNWLRYKMNAVLFWDQKHSRSAGGTSDIFDLLNKLNQVEENVAMQNQRLAIKKEATDIFRLKLQVLQSYWETKKNQLGESYAIDYLNTSTENFSIVREVGFVLNKIYHFSHSKGEALALEPPIVINLDSKLNDEALADSLFADFHEKILLAPYDDFAAAFLKNCVQNLLRFKATQLLTSQEALIELVTEIQHILQFRVAPLESKDQFNPIELQEMLNRFDQLNFTQSTKLLANEVAPFFHAVLTNPAASVWKIINSDIEDLLNKPFNTSVAESLKSELLKLISSSSLKQSASIIPFFGKSKKPQEVLVYEGMLKLLALAESNTTFPPMNPSENKLQFLERLGAQHNGVVHVIHPK